MTRTTFLGLVASSIALSGCSTVQRYHVPPPGLIDDTITPSRVLFGKNEIEDTRTIAQAFLRSYELAYDTSVPSKTSLPDKLENRDANALDMTRLGMTVIEVRCDAFFESIGRGSQKLSFFRRQIEILSTALTTALGLSGATDTIVAAAGIGSGATLSTLANYETTYFFSPDIGKVQHLVDDGLAIMRQALLASDIAPRDFESAIRALKKYQTVCTAHEIKRLVNEAVGNGTVRAVSLGASVDPLVVATGTIVDGVKIHLGTSVQLRDLALMKWVIEDAPTADQLDFICPSFTSADLRSTVCKGDLGGRTINPLFSKGVHKVADAIAAIDQLQPDLLDKTLVTWKAAEKVANKSISDARSAASVAIADSKTKADAKVTAIQAALDAAQRVDLVVPANGTSQIQPSLIVVPSKSP